MAERPDDAMIEIGDPTEEPVDSESTPPVIIQYHERGGVPWMLIPPMLAISAVGSILLYHKLAPRRDAVSSPALVQSDRPPGPIAAPEPDPAATPATAEPIVQAEVKVDEVKPVEGLPEVVPPPVAPPSTTIEPPVDPAPTTPPPVARRPPVRGLGFDPKALEADRNGEAPADSAIAPVAREDRPEARDLPREVDPDLLPPDPREARRRQEQRKLEVARKVDEERVRFHAELRSIVTKFREASWPAIVEMRQNYDLKVDPAAEKQAAYLLGKGKYAGADRRTRIALLRSLGYPEPVILDNLFITYEKRQIGERDGPRSEEEAYYLTSLSLLRNPPRPASPPARSVSNR